MQLKERDNRAGSAGATSAGSTQACPSHASDQTNGWTKQREEHGGLVTSSQSMLYYAVYIYIYAPYTVYIYISISIYIYIYVLCTYVCIHCVYLQLGS